MTDWNPNQYMQFGSERTRAAMDLCNRIELDCPRTIVDLGCGPGNSTRILRTRWPRSQLIGIDNSPAMIDAAKKSPLACEWVDSDLADWKPCSQVDLLFSNAVLQWVPEHDALIRRLFGFLAIGGALAFQIPSNTFPTVRKLIHDISNQPAWHDRLETARNALSRHPPEFYYDILCKQAVRLDIWETEYHHVVESSASVIEWISSTGLRPFLDALATDTEREAFLSELRAQTAMVYQTRPDGKVLFPFRRTFVIAYR